LGNKEVRRGERKAGRKISKFQNTNPKQKFKTKNSKFKTQNYCSISKKNSLYDLLTLMSLPGLDQRDTIQKLLASFQPSAYRNKMTMLVLKGKP
jgi:hypothetical protein